MTKVCLLAVAWIGLVSAPALAQSVSGEGNLAAAEGQSAAPARADGNASSSAEALTEDSGPPTLFGSVSHVGGYGGLSVMYSRMAGEDGVLVGGEGAVLIDHRLSLGGGGYGWARDSRGPADVDGVPRDLEVGYGGFMIRYSLITGGLVYGSVGALVGGGAVALHRDSGNDAMDDRHDAATDAFFVFEPQVSVQVNLLRWMRVGLQGGYRITSGIDQFGYSEADINGLTLGGTLQFGRL
jgi:hypothetical protein